MVILNKSRLVLAISSKYTLEAIEEFYDGILLACEKYKVDVIGGDITSCINGLTISITAIGEAMKKEIVKRSGAKENDLLITTGDLEVPTWDLMYFKERKRFGKVTPICNLN